MAKGEFLLNCIVFRAIDQALLWLSQEVYLFGTNILNVILFIRRKMLAIATNYNYVIIPWCNWLLLALLNWFITMIWHKCSWNIFMIKSWKVVKSFYICWTFRYWEDFCQMLKVPQNMNQTDKIRAISIQWNWK